MRAAAAHFHVIDLIKAVACNLIVLHHLAFYGPMSDVARPLNPELFEWLEDHARVAVHAFLAMGGFLAAKSLAGAKAAVAPAHALAQRFLKLVPPFMVAMLLAVAASLLASAWMTHDSISPPPTLGQVVAHAFLLHGVLGYESLSAGAWYVAIDFQLFAMLTVILWLTRRGPRWLAPAAVAGGAAASLMVFNLDPAWDVWGLYFFGSYALGALAWWASEHSRDALGAAILTGVIMLLGGVALEFAFRSRITLALATALLLVLACRGGLRLPARSLPLASFLGRISYAVFLVHFPVCLVVNAAFIRFAPAIPEVQAAGMLLAWAASIGAGAAFHRWVELPLASLSPARRGSGNAVPAAVVN